MILMLILLLHGSFADEERKLPEGLMIGTATSSYQVEGAWNVSGKGENIWDRMVHTRPNSIIDRSNGDVACDSYNLYKVDVKLMKDMGFQFYRFSISWSRILPTGFPDVINPDGIRYYNDLINELLANGIEPMVTLFHWDLPQSLQDLGGWTNAKIVRWFEDYSKVIFDNFGDRVKYWITINEPKQVCLFGYGVDFLAPALSSSGIGEYMCSRNLLMAHATVYHLYKKVYQWKQKGRISITVECSWSEPGTNSTRDIEATERRLQFDFGIYTHPVYSRKGDFPLVVRKAIEARSKLEGFTESRLPYLTPREVLFIRGTYDFFGLNYYSTFYVKDRKPDPVGTPSYIKDLCVDDYQDPNWLTGTFSYNRNVPWGFRKLLSYIKKNYGNPDIIITENGFSDNAVENDNDRTTFFRDHIAAMIDAVKYDRVRVKAFTVWSLMDNFEWAMGYSVRFGLHHIDFNDPNLTRVPKKSARFFKNLLTTRTLI